MIKNSNLILTISITYVIFYLIYSQPGTKNGVFNMKEYEKFITKQGLDKLLLKLEGLKSKRPELLDGVISARDIPGDDNSDLTLAVSVIESLDSQIKDVTDIIDSSEVYICQNLDVVEFGDLISLSLNGKPDASYKIVGTNEIGFFANNSCMSVMSPIAQSVMSQHIGDEVDIELPSGFVVYEITGIKKFPVA